MFAREKVEEMGALGVGSEVLSVRGRPGVWGVLVEAQEVDGVSEDDEFVEAGVEEI